MVDYSGTRKRTHFVWAADDGNTAHLGTAQIAKLLGVPMGWHPIIYKMKGIETALSSAQQFLLWVDPNYQNNQIDLLNITYQANLIGGGSDGDVRIEDSMHHAGWQSLWINVDANDSFAAEDVGGPYHCYNNLVLVKAEAATWTIQIEYELVPGAMYWLDEWAELLRDRQNAPHQDAAQAAGIRYSVVGDYYQLNKRTYT